MIICDLNINTEATCGMPTLSNVNKSAAAKINNTQHGIDFNNLETENRGAIKQQQDQTWDPEVVLVAPGQTFETLDDSLDYDPETYMILASMEYAENVANNP